KAFEPSISAAARDGPKNDSPAARIASPRPAASGTSGPHTTRSARSATAAATSSPIASAAIGTPVTFASPAIPGLPGAATIISHWGLCPSFQASACSRPPEPTKKTRIRGPDNSRGSVPEVALAGDHHGEAVLVGGGDRLG